jgi:hypothetical protein
MEGPVAFGKRIDKPGGGRKAIRAELALRAVIMTVTDTISVDLLDISKTGARLRAPDLPGDGQEIMALLGGLEAFAKVIWREADECGIQFDIPLSDRTVAIVEGERVPVTLDGLGPDAIFAASDWHNGLAR